MSNASKKTEIFILVRSVLRIFTLQLFCSFNPKLIHQVHSLLFVSTNFFDPKKLFCTAKFPFTHIHGSFSFRDKYTQMEKYLFFPHSLRPASTAVVHSLFPISITVSIYLCISHHT